MKRIRKKSIMIIALSLITVALSVFFIFGALGKSQGVYAVEVEGKEYGLMVNLQGEHILSDNMKPGDKENSTMTVSIQGEDASSNIRYPIFLRAQITENNPGMGDGNLDDSLQLTVTRQDDTQVYTGSISGLSEYVEVGILSKGQSMELDFAVHLPRRSTCNNYQGASLKVRWVVMTEGALPAPTPMPTPTPTPLYEDEELEDIDIVDEPLPEGVPDEYLPEDIQDKEDLDDEDIPGAIPQTGELPPILFYGLGAAIVSGGIIINVKKRK